MRFLLIALSASFLVGCASVSELPQSASQANFDSKEGKTGWSKYEDTIFLNGVDKRTAYLATKSGLSDAGFIIKKADYEKLVVAGEHGMTAVDWNVIAGVYLREKGGGTEVKVIIQGSKDLGITGDNTADNWSQKIFKGIRQYIALESGIGNPAKKHFQ